MLTNMLCRSDECDRRAMGLPSMEPELAFCTTLKRYEWSIGLWPSAITEFELPAEKIASIFTGLH